MRGEKTAEDQGVPWMKTRVCCGMGGEGFVVVVVVGGGERRAYLICQLSWWKVDGRGIVFAWGNGIVLEDYLYCGRVQL